MDSNTKKEEKMEVSQTAKGEFEEIELALDLQEYINHSKDVKVNSNLKKEIFGYGPDLLLSVTKKIQSPIEIVSVKVVDHKFVKDAFPSVSF